MVSLRAMNTALKPLLLHAHSTGPNPIKIAIALEFLGVPYTVKLWELGDNPENGVKSEKFLKINENGRVPALDDPNTGVLSWESGAVMNYVRRVYDKENKLGPRGETEQDIVDFEKWEYFLLTTLGPMTGQYNWFRHFHETDNQDALKRYEAQTYRCYDVLEKQLMKSDGTSVIPGGVCAVDAHFEPWVKQHEYAGLSIDNYPLISKWLKTIGDMKEVKAAYAKIKTGPQYLKSRR